MSGVVTIYVNREGYKEGEEDELLKSLAEVNAKEMAAVAAAGFPIMLVPTISEATRTEKVDFAKQFPIYTPKLKTQAELEIEIQEAKHKKEARKKLATEDKV
jgi:hypothetical protein